MFRCDEVPFPKTKQYGIRYTPLQTHNKKRLFIFLDNYVDGTRYKEYLKLYVSKDYIRPENKNVARVDKENWELALAIQAKKLTSNATVAQPAAMPDKDTYYILSAIDTSHPNLVCPAKTDTVLVKVERCDTTGVYELPLREVKV